jgi:hypothetical protein
VGLAPVLDLMGASLTLLRASENVDCATLSG